MSAETITADPEILAEMEAVAQGTLSGKKLDHVVINRIMNRAAKVYDEYGQNTERSTSVFPPSANSMSNRASRNSVSR